MPDPFWEYYSQFDFTEDDTRLQSELEELESQFPETRVQQILNAKIPLSLEERFSDTQSLGKIAKLRKQGWDEETIWRGLDADLQHAEAESTRREFARQKPTP